MDRRGRDTRHYDKKTSALSGSFLPSSAVVFNNSGIMHELDVNPLFPFTDSFFLSHFEKNFFF